MEGEGCRVEGGRSLLGTVIKAYLEFLNDFLKATNVR